MEITSRNATTRSRTIGSPCNGGTSVPPALWPWVGTACPDFGGNPHRFDQLSRHRPVRNAAMCVPWMDGKSQPSHNMTHDDALGTGRGDSVPTEPSSSSRSRTFLCDSTSMAACRPKGHLESYCRHKYVRLAVCSP